MFTKSVPAKCPYSLGRSLKDLKSDGLDYTVKSELSRYSNTPTRQENMAAKKPEIEAPKPLGETADCCT